MTTPNPLQTLREALVEAKESNRKAVVHSSDPFIITHAGTTQSALTRAEAALRELESEPRYTVEEVLAILAEWRTPGAEPGERPTLSSLQLGNIKRHLAGSRD